MISSNGDERLHFRAAVLTDMGANSSEIFELLRYGSSLFQHETAASLSFPLGDETFIETWTHYAKCSEATGGISFLRNHLVQLRFPIREGISQTLAYKDVTLRGRDPNTVAEATGLHLAAPEKCRIVIHATAAGRIPLLVAALREDFVALTQAFTGRNEAIFIPESMGASCVAGYNNWHRISLLRRDWERIHPTANTAADWIEEFQHRIIPKKELYQDRFIILSEGPYSGVPARAMGMSEEQWRDISFIIRREHECAHYFTRRAFSSMRNYLLDELIADYCGICAAAGKYRADWFLRFVGLENHPHCRGGSRLQSYRGVPPLSDSAFSLLQSLVVRAAVNLGRWSEENPDEAAYSPADPRILMVLTRFTLEELASPEAANLLKSEFGPVSEPGKDTQ
jgi:hypothetical protein